jgi:hypothetical protein
VLVMVGFGIAHAALGVPAGARLAVAVLIALLVGLESATLRRWTLLRAGWREAGIVVADDLETAEQRYFARRVEGAAGSEPAWSDAPAPRLRPAGRGVLGLFPLPGAGR